MSRLNNMEKQFETNNINHMINYYKVLGVSEKSTRRDIKKAYVKRIQPYNKLSTLSTTDKKQIKIIKVSKYVLLNNELKELYDNILHSRNKYINEDDKIHSDAIGNRIFSLKNIINIPNKI